MAQKQLPFARQIKRQHKGLGLISGLKRLLEQERGLPGLVRARLLWQTAFTFNPEFPAGAKLPRIYLRGTDRTAVAAAYFFQEREAAVSRLKLFLTGAAVRSALGHFDVSHR